ncbi:hypothetical protein GCM10010278_86470 [Streptomyces melanogenes]|nr:hypothetical protein GCM10010278_86470 [Streptomyces melanogenes]
MKPLSRTAAAFTLTVAVTGAAAVTATSAHAVDNRCYITASAANVRAKATTRAVAVGVAYKGWSCAALDYSYPGDTQWAKIRVNRTGVVGWVRGDLLHTPGEGGHTCIPENCPR